MKRILLVEDDASLARALSHSLGFEGFEIEWVADGSRAINAAKQRPPDIVLLDVNLPGSSGFDLCAAWQQQRSFPIIMLTARNRKEDKLLGFKLGADDYVTKPFDLDELLARIDAVLRRAASRRVERVVLGPITIDFVKLLAEKHGHPLPLSHREFELVRYLAEHSSSIVYREELLREVWGYPDAPQTRALDQAIAKLRKKIEADPHHPRFIHTVHGDGYRLTPDRSESA